MNDLVARAGWTVAGLTVLAACLRFPTLGSQSYWYDEVFTADIVGGSVSHLASGVADTESTPPLYYILAWLWTKPLGTSETALRSLSAVASTAMVPAAYLAGRALVTRRVGLGVAALTAVSPMLVWYAQEARAYALFAFLGACALAAFAEAQRRPGEPWLLLSWGGLSALTLTAHYFAVFAIAPQAAWLLWCHARRRRVLAALIPVLAVGTILLPLALHQAREEHSGWISVIPSDTRAKALLVEFLWETPPLANGGAIVALALGAFAAFLVVRRSDRDERRGSFLAFGLGATSVMLPFVLAVAGIDYAIGRNMILAWIPFVVFLAGGLTSRRAGLPGTAVIVALIVSSLALVVAGGFRSDWQRHDWRAAAAAVRPGDLLVLLGDYPKGQRIAIGHYAPALVELPSGGAALREIVAIGYEFGGSAEDRYDLPGSFRITERRRLSGRPRLYLTRYRSDTLQQVAPEDVIVRAGERPELLLLPG